MYKAVSTNIGTESVILQLDGNISCDSSIISESQCSCCDRISRWDNSSISDHESEILGLPIPVVMNFSKGDSTDRLSSPPWYEEYNPWWPDPWQSKLNRKTIKRDNRVAKSEFLPTISVSNMRSLGPKVKNFRIDMIEREISAALLSEVWEKASCNKQQFEIEKMFQLDGLKYISTPRTQKRGGGAAIVVNTEKFSLEKIDVSIPHNLEVVWGLIRPKKITANIREIIIGAFYSPPSSRKNSKLLDHMMSTTHYLLSKYPNAGLVLGGDKNSLNIAPLVSGLPRMRQIVTRPTYKQKILDVIITNMHALYSVPVIAPPVQPDNPQYGVPSDHSTVVAVPLAQGKVLETREYISRTFRPLPESGLKEFGQWICLEGWEDIPEKASPTEQVSKFEEKIFKKLDTILPPKTVKINPNWDKPYITLELKKMDRQIKRQYRRHGKSEKYIKMKMTYDLKMKKAAQAYLDKNVQSLKEDDPGRAYTNLKKMAAQPGDGSSESNFTLLSHLSENLSCQESVERIAQHFSQISQEFPPLNIDSLPVKVKAKISAPIMPDQLPDIPDHLVYQKIKSSKKPRSGVPRDLPRRIVKEFAPELAKPAGKILRSIVTSGQWPKQWRTEFGTPIQKQQNPISEDHLRIISLTPYLSKVCEQFVIIWLLEHIGHKLDWGQYGGVKGSSISHYLIDFVNFILFNQDLKVPHAVIAAMVDFQKAFNKINHNVIITLLSEMGVPGWLLRIVAGFLTDREMIVRHNGCNSSRQSLPGGGPQGTRLGLFIFLILINAAGFSHLEKHMGVKMTGNMNKRTPIPHIHMKYIDDLSLAESVNLKEALMVNPNPTHPLQYHDRTHHLLPTSGLQLY